MLFKDSKKHELSEKDRNEFLEVIRKFPVSIVYVPEKANIVKDGNGKPKRVFPPGVDVDLKYTIQDEKGSSSEFVWAESVRVSDKKNIYYPTSYHFGPVNVFNKEDIELLWFLWRCVPVLRYGKNAGPGIHEIMFNLPFENQKKEVDYNRQLSMAQSRVCADEKDISDAQLKEIANSLFIPNIDKLERIELQFQIGELLKTGNQKYDKIKILDHFLKLTENPKLQKVSSMVQSGIDKGFLIFDETNRQILIQVDDKKEKIGKKVPPNKDFKEWAVNALLIDEDNLTFLELALS